MEPQMVKFYQKYLTKKKILGEEIPTKKSTLLTLLLVIVPLSVGYEIVVCEF